MPERIDRGPQRGERILHGRKFVQVDAAAHVDRNVAREQGIHVRMRASEMPRYDRDLPGRRSAREQPLYPLHDEARFVAIVLGALVLLALIVLLAKRGKPRHPTQPRAA